MTKQEILRGIDSMDLYDKDYETIMALLTQLDDRLFVRIMTEILEGNLFFSDFEDVFPDRSYAKAVSERIASQESIAEKAERLAYFRTKISGDKPDTASALKYMIVNPVSELSDDENKKLSKLIAAIPAETLASDAQLKEYLESSDNSILSGYLRQRYDAAKYKTLSAERKSDFIYSLLDSKPGESDLAKEARIKIFRSILNGKSGTKSDIHPEDLLTSLKSDMIPLYYEDQELDRNDIDFMKRNEIGEERMKQIKSLCAFYRDSDMESAYDQVAYLKATKADLGI